MFDLGKSLKANKPNLIDTTDGPTGCALLVSIGRLRLFGQGNVPV